MGLSGAKPHLSTPGHGSMSLPKQQGLGCICEPYAASGYILERRERMREAGGHQGQKSEQDPLLCLVVPDNVTWNERPRRV